MRSDGRRNREAIVAAAAEEFRRAGPSASLEDIAHRAGVGSATLHRHFAGRRALLEAVYRAEVERLAASTSAAGQQGLWPWLDELVRHCARDRPLLAAMEFDSPPHPGSRGVADSASWAPLRTAALPLVESAHLDGELRHEVGVDDLLALVDSIGRTAAGDPDAAGRLFAIVRRGSAPSSDGAG